MRIPSAAKALLVLTAVGFLVSGCHYHHRAYYGGHSYASPSHGYKHHHKSRKHGHKHHRHGRRGYY